ncbi:MAG: hypothetical protein D3909_12730, partial [Candidatus Electrothrix sp. ATG1]|nr:hypothetical protein [Candidatus Electrothrix sp. ATG1]
MQIMSCNIPWLRCKLITSVTSLCVLFPLLACGVELAGHIALQGRYFTEEPKYVGQKEHDASVVVEPELYHAFTNGASLLLKPFVRLDTPSDQRNHWDIREASVLYPREDWEVEVGISKVFWGATEFVHLVDA